MRRALAMVVLLAACGNDRSKPPAADDGGRTRREFPKPAGEVRAVPPHAIRTDGVGPYRLGAPLADVLDLLPHGPRVVLFELPDLVDFSLVRAENDTLLIGAERATGVAYVAVLDREIARTEAGVGVGATVTQLDTALGARDADPQRLRDPRVRVYSALPNARFVTSGDRVAAVLVGVEGRPRVQPAPTEPPAAVGLQPEPPPPPRCAPVTATAEAIAAARLDRDRAAIAAGCMGATESIAVVWTAERVALVAGEPGKLRRLDAQEIGSGQVLFAGPIDVDRDGRDEVAVVTRRDGEGSRTWRLQVYRYEQGKLVAKLEKDVYGVSARSAQLVGARLEEVDLLLDLSSDGESVRAGGLFLHGGAKGPRNLAPLRPGPPLRWRIAEPPPAPAGVGADAGPRGTGDEPAPDPAAPAPDRSPP